MGKSICFLVRFRHARVTLKSSAAQHVMTSTVDTDISLKRGQKLRYLLSHHGCLREIARATGLSPASITRVAAGLPLQQEAFRFGEVACRQIERELDLPERWFDVTTFLPHER
jgi:hypothetical protein